MAVFDPQADLDRNLAFHLMINTSVTLYWRSSLLDQAATWLDQHGYQLIHLNASGWGDEGAMHTAISTALDFPDYYGRNLDALNDCMRDVVGQDYGWAPESTGLVIVFTGYDSFAGSCPRAAQVVLDIIAVQSRDALLFGRQLICLVHSNDPDIRFGPVGAVPVMWNDAEWLDSKRHP